MNKAFTLIETLVAVGILGVLLVSVGGMMGMSFKAKRQTESSEKVSSRAVFVLGELKKNILEAQADKINCPEDVGSSISFTGKNGGLTTLLCDSTTGQVASVSATGNFNLLNEEVVASSCENFVTCNLSGGSEVMSVGFSLSLGISGSSDFGPWMFQSIVAPRE